MENTAKFLQKIVNRIIEITDNIRSIENGIVKYNSAKMQKFYQEIRTQKKALEIFELENYYLPFLDRTTKILLMSYRNNGFSYGIAIEKNEVIFCLCESPILEAKILKIVSKHKNFEDMKTAFFEQKTLLF